ncbi:MAG: DUF3419 family protein [Chitinophagaceae bacterium]|nr:DUF3419 family protein [Chitinophagaceae bacterium]
MTELAKQVDFGLIRYANCWEDADVLLQGLSLQQGANVLCVASAGDNALSLLTTYPGSVVAVDVSEVQLCLVELKKAAFAILEYEELLVLLGVRGCTATLRLQLYGKVREKLSSTARKYWDEHKTILENGVIYSGKFERYFKQFREYILPFAHNKRAIIQLLERKSAEEQQVFYDKHWNTFRFRILMNVFFSKYVLGKYGRDPEFLKHVQVPVAQYIRQRAEQHLASLHCQDNYFVHMIFTGSFGALLPHYLRAENFPAIKSNIHKLELKHTSVQEAAISGKYDAYCLSNIFEYMSATDFRELALSWVEHIPKGATLAYWNLMAPRSCSEVASQAYIYNIKSKELTDLDNGFFYSRFIIEQRT